MDVRRESSSRRRKAGLAVLGGALAIALTGCSVDALIWGQEGSRVIETTEDLVRAMAEGQAFDAVCADSVADLGEPGDWRGLSAGEPERFNPDYWADQTALDPQWNINLEGLPDGLAAGNEFPGDVFYRETEDGLCVIDIAWSTLIAEG